MYAKHLMRLINVLCIAVGLGLVTGGAALADSTYSFVGVNYSTVTNNTTCTVGTCASYTTSQHIVGSFTTTLPLGGGLVDFAITPASYSFNDGVNTIASSNPEARIYRFKVYTDGQGRITAARIIVSAWTTATHTTLGRSNGILINADSAVNNAGCSSVITSPESGVTDICNAAADSNTSFAQQSTQGVWTSPAPSAVPTLSEWALILLGSVLALGGFWWTRKRLAFSA